MGQKTCSYCYGLGNTKTYQTIRNPGPGGSTHITVSKDEICALCGGSGSVYEPDPVPVWKPEAPPKEPQFPNPAPSEPEEPGPSGSEDESPADRYAFATTTVLVFLIATGYLVNDGMEWGGALLLGFFIGIVGGYLWRLVWGVIMIGAFYWIYATFFL